jgi:signal transduction histidine kinase/ligand-binding sensor domain-containing protein
MLAALLRSILLVAGALLASPTVSQPQYTHSRWTSANGVPGMIFALAQTPDGYLWLATYEGLYRFDGVSFEHVQPAAGHPPGAIRTTSVFVSSQGELWVGYAGRGGAAVFRGGRLVRVPMPRPPGEVTGFQEDAAGGIWASGGREPDTLSRFWHGRWSSIGQEHGLPPEFVTSMLSARDGNFWVTSRNHLLFLRPAGKAFEDTGERLEDGTSLAEDPSGNIWISGPSGTRMIPDYPRGKRTPSSTRTYPAATPVRRANIIFDHTGALWGTTYTGGAFSINAPGRDPAVTSSVRRFRTQEGLTSNQALGVLEDREKNIWIATEIGLDQYRRAAVQEATLPPRSSPRGLKMAADRSGSIYVANGNVLYHAAPGGSLRSLRSEVDVAALCPDRDEGIWLSLPGRVELLRNGRRARTIRLPPHVDVATCGVDRDGQIWIAAVDRGVLTFSGQVWQQVSFPKGLAPPRELVINQDGVPVVMFGNMAVAEVRPRGVVTLRDDQLGVAGLTGLFPTTDGLLIGGGTGLARWDGRKITRISIDDQPWLRGIRGLVQTRLGETWLLSNKGIYRVATAALRKLFDNPRLAVPRDYFGEQDGLRSHTNGDDGRQALQGGDGRLWFLTLQGPVWIDPRNLPTNTVAPRVIIHALTVGNKRFTDPRRVQLEAGTGNLSIDYTALSLSVPNRVAFKYKLEGVDRTWVDPGTRRQAFYTNLAPGDYRFRVIAANDKGVWNERGATLDFTIPPLFTQTWLFYLVCALGLACVLWSVYALRVRSIARRLHLRSAERTSERERIARELHDTLLQTINALMLRFHVAAGAVTDVEVRHKLDVALDRAEEALVEGRERVSELRQERESEELEATILGVVGRQLFPPELKVRVRCFGEARPIRRTLLKEVEAIVGEALFNVSRHAQASKVDVDIAFEATEFSISVRDDGVGIDPSILALGRRSGHFGLPGMKERARQGRGSLVIQSEPGRGTLIRLTVTTEDCSVRRPPSLLAWLGRRKRPAIACG